MTADSHDAVMQWWLREFDASTHALADLQAAHRSNGFEWGEAFCGWFLGSAAWLSGDMTQAGEHYTRSLEIYRRVGDYTFIAWTLLPLANITLVSGELDQATALYEQSLRVMGDIADRHGVGAVLLGMGLAAHYRGDTEKARTLLEEAQTNLREGGGGQGISWPLSNVLVDTHTHDLLVETVRRYENALNLPLEEWVAMVCSDGEAWMARAKS